MDYNEFANSIKQKYPQYNSVDNLTLAKKIIEKYPQYGIKVTFNNPTNQTNNQSSDNAFGSFSTGVAKGELSTLKSLGTIGTGILRAGAGLVAGDKGREFVNKNTAPIYQKGTVQEQNANKALTPKNTAETIGKGTEQIAEYLIPASKISKAQNLVDTAIQGSGFLKAAGRVLAKSGIEAAGTAGVRYVQTANAKDALKTGLTAGIIKGGISATGEVLNAARIPEKLYGTIFKNSYRDMQDELRMMGTKEFQRTNPERFKQLVNSGIIKVNTDGNVIVNETLAKQALDRGLKGSLKSMSNETVRQLYENEAKAQDLVNNFSGTIKLNESDKLSGLLDEISTDYKNVGGNFSEDAKALSDQIKNGEIDGNTALKLRRFLDGMRIRSSFNPGQKLSQSQENFKYFANSLRKELAKIPDFADNMKSYTFNIEALDALAKEAARRGNRQLLGYIDSVLLGSGIAAGNPGLGTGVGIARRLLQSPTALTKGGQIISKLGKSSTGGVLTRQIIGKTISSN